MKALDYMCCTVYLIHPEEWMRITKESLDERIMMENLHCRLLKCIFSPQN